MATETVTSRIAAIEAELARLRNPGRKDSEPALPPKLVSPDAQAAEQRQRADAAARQAQAEAYAAECARQAERDAPKRAKRDKQIAALAERRDAAQATADRAEREADELTGEIRAIEREPLSPEIPKPACMQPRPILVGDPPESVAELARRRGRRVKR
jgi:hypothetical protein